MLSTLIIISTSAIAFSNQEIHISRLPSADQSESLNFAEQQVVALVNGQRAYDYDLELEKIALKHYEFRSGGSPGAQEAACWIKERFESFGLQTWLEPFEFTTWNLSSRPSLVIDDDGNPNTTVDQVIMQTFLPTHLSWPTPAEGVFADLVVLPLPEAANESEIGLRPINATAWAVDTTGKIVLTGKEVRWTYKWLSVFNDKLVTEPPAAVIFTCWYDWMAFTPPILYSFEGKVYWNEEVPVGDVDYNEGLWIRNRENTKNVSAYVSINSTIGVGTHYNVVGKIAGYKNPGKCIIISSHYDTVTCCGFCDNGAGTAGVIELAKVLSDAARRGFYKPKYTLLFVTFTSEEFYLVGSANYVREHKSEMPNIVAVINLDCIGSDEFYVTDTNPVGEFDLDQTVSDAARDLGITATLEPPTASDHETFRNPQWVNNRIQSYWDFDANISDATPVESSTMLESWPLFYSDKWDMGTPGWIHTSYDNSTSTATLNWVEVEDLENHIKIAALTAVRVSPNTCIIVPDDYPTIQKAINNASEWDTIFVRNGTYFEHVVVNKTVTLVGENRHTTIIDGNGTGNVVLVIAADNVTITEFTVRNGSNGFYVLGFNQTITGNIIFNNTYHGIDMIGVKNSIIENTLSNNSYGIILDGSSYNVIRRNTVSGSEDGLNLGEDCENNTIVENTLTENAIGINIAESNNTVFHNNFINNTKQVQVDNSSHNCWDDDYPSGGNYWSDYKGVDLYGGPYKNETGSDGMGDSAYLIDENNTDRFPLMNPYSYAHALAVIDVKINKTVLCQGFTAKIYVDISNQGNFTEIFNVTAYADTISIQTKLVTLTSGDYETVTFTWNATGFANGNYSVSAYITPVLGETNIEDNTFVNGKVYVSIAGDVNADRKVDMRDIGICCWAYGSYPTHPRWKPNADINDDGKVDMKDIGYACVHYGQHQ
jgi:parallel beta-helix repeat protein